MEGKDSNDFDNLLLDDLMERGVINVDINLGVNPEQVADFELNSTESWNLKASPSHESDSGISTMSSPCHSVLSSEDSSDGDEQPEIFPDLFDAGIVDYFCDGKELDDAMNEIDTLAAKCDSSQVDSLMEDIENAVPTENLQETQPVLMDNDVCSNSNGSVKCADKTNNNLRRSLRSVQNVPKSKDSVEEKVDNKVPAVKVIKVIKTPSSSSRKQAEQQIYDAIEERNRKNAIQAKMNRERKKAYISSLEDEIKDLKTENDELREGQDKLRNANRALEDEVMYLKSVLANQSSLSSLLKNIPNVKDVRLTSSFSHRKRSADLDHDYEMPSKRTKKTAGVCLHVDSNNVSLEFCAQCSRRSQLEEV